MEAAPNYIPSLQELSLPGAIDHIQRDVYFKFPDKLTPKFSKLLLDHLHIPHLAIPKKIMEKIRNHFSITHLTLGENNYNFFAELQKSRRPQMIEKLELLSLKDSSITKRNPKKKGKSLDIVSFLTKSLQPECRQILESLTLQGTSVSFPQGWIRDLHKSLPALKILDVTGCSLANDDFKTLCQTYKQLTSLSIGKTKVNDITGIEALSELTFLSLEDLKYQKANCLYSVFLLKKLVGLDISSNGSNAPTAKLLTKRGTPMPNLQSLDCCGNELTDEIMEALFKQCPKLQSMAVINTIYDKTTAEQFAEFKEGATFINVSDLALCGESLMIYHSHEQRCQYILKQMRHSLRFELGTQSPLNMKKCVKGLVQVLRSNAQINNEKFEVLQCFFCMFNHRTVPTIFTTREREEIARAVIKVLAVTNWTDDSTTPETCYNMFLVGSKLFSNTCILDKNQELIPLVAVTIMKTLSKEVRVKAEHVMLMTGNYMWFFRDRLLKAGQFTDEEIDNFKSTLFHCVENDRGQNANHFHSFMKLLSMVLNVSDKVSYRTGDLLAAIFMKIGAYKKNKELVEMSFANALKLYTSLEGEEARNRIFRRECFDNIETILRGCSPECHYAALKFLLQIYRFHENGHDREPYSVEELMVLVPDIASLIYQYSENSGIFLYISNRSNNCVVQDWASWMFEKVHRRRSS